MRPTDTAKVLTTRINEVVHRLLPNGKEYKGEWCVGSIHGEAGSSLKVVLDGPLKGAWKDFAGNESGDLIGLWKTVKGLTLDEANKEALEFLGIPDDDIYSQVSQTPRIETKAQSETWKGIQAKMRKGTQSDMEALAALRKIPATAGLELASAAGHLYFGEVWDDGFEYESWIITDDSRRNAQARRMDGQMWGKGMKCKTIKGCQASWPVGLHGLNGQDVAFVEGSPDLLAAWHLIWMKGLKGKVSPVAMFGASMVIPTDALPLLKGKNVFTFPHNDPAGHKAMDDWSTQLRSAKAATVVGFDLRPKAGKDLNDLVTEIGAEEDQPVLEIFFKVPGQIEAKPLIGYQYPSEDDPNILLGKDDYLGRGGGMLFVSHAGAGKSSWIMDACLMWGLGRPWMGIKCSSPLKSLIIQAEDSDRYMGKIAASFAHVNKLTETEITELNGNCLIARVKGRSGDLFFAELKRLTDLHQPDLVVINPIYLYAQGDIGRAEFAQPFLIGLDDVNKAEKFAYILIHHTGKPTAKGKDGKRAEVDDWESAYMGFGSSYLANWPRCSALLEPIASKPGSFLIKLGKGGFNAGIVKEVDQGAGKRFEPVTRIAIKHSTNKIQVGNREKPLYYWEIDEEPPTEITNQKGSGRKQKYEIESFFRSFPTEIANALPAPQIWKRVDDYSGIPLTSFKDLVERAVKDGKIVLVQNQDKRSLYYYQKPDYSTPLVKWD